MKIEEFIREVLKQITSACQTEGVFAAKEIEFDLRLNEKGEICKCDDICISTIKVKL